MSEKTQSEEFTEDEEVEESPGAGDELDIEHLIDICHHDSLDSLP